LDPCGLPFCGTDSTVTDRLLYTSVNDGTDPPYECFNLFPFCKPPALNYTGVRRALINVV